MRRYFAQAFIFAACFQTGPAYSQPWPLPCNPVAVTESIPNLKQANTVYLRFLESTFPERFVSPYNPNDVIQDVRGLMRSALSEAALKWNRNCGQLPVLNDQPVLVPTHSAFEIAAGTKGAYVVDVSFVASTAPEDPEGCGDPFPTELCHKTVARSFIRQDGAELVIYQRTGSTNHPNWTLFDFRGAYTRLFQHELGHILLMDHDICPQSPLQDPIPNRFVCAPYSSCELTARSEHCDLMEELFEPADPLDKVLGEDPLSLCRLRHYCDIDPWLPWSKVRSGCTWFEDVSQTYVDTYDSDGVHIGGAVHNYISYGCFGGGFNLSPLAGETSPFLMVGFPKNGATAQGGLLKLTGWVWGRSHPLRELRVFVDREDARLVDFAHPVDSHAICNLGFDPGYCDPHSGFSGKIDIHGLAPGAHKLLIVATDMADDPLPSYIELEFHVPQTFVNHPPSPQDDELNVTMIEGAGRETSIAVLANDFDVDGQPIALASNAVVAFPRSGSLTYLESGEFLYTPFPWSTGADSFRYRIVDTLGATAEAEVRIQFMEIILLP